MSSVPIIRGAGRSDIGKRNLNEDAFLVEESLGLMLVADGVGGHRVGEIASTITCETIAREISAGKNLDAALRQANVDVRIAAENEPGRQGMASTVVALQFHDANYEIAWIGDSRAYLWDGQLRLLTEDHSYVQTLLNSNTITLEQARHHPQKSAIIQAIGLQEDGDLQVGKNSGTLGKDQILLLCSDGLNDVVDSSRLTDILSADNDLNSCCDLLVAEAVKSGGRDNITVVLVKGTTPDLAVATLPKRIYWSFDPVTQSHTITTDIDIQSPSPTPTNITGIPARGDEANDKGIVRTPLLRKKIFWLFISATLIVGGAIGILSRNP